MDSLLVLVCSLWYCWVHCDIAGFTVGICVYCGYYYVHSGYLCLLLGIYMFTVGICGFTVVFSGSLRVFVCSL